MLNRMDLEEKIKGWSEPEQFIVRELYDMKSRCPACTTTLANHEKRLEVIEKTPIRIGKHPLPAVATTGGAAAGGGLVVLLGQYAIQAILQRLLGG